jgi:sugar phosphate isomerase/epimerase
MTRPVTLCAGQWADLPLETLAAKARDFGFDGLELCCNGDHFEVAKAMSNAGYCERQRQTLAKYGLQMFSLSNHLVGQAILDPVDLRHKAILPAHVWGDGDPAGVSARAAEELKNTARAAKKLGLHVVNGFTGSSIWHLLYSFPPVPPAMIDAGFALLAERFHPILDVFAECDVKFALEVHPTEIAFDIHTAERALAALDNRPEFGFNFDPSHLIWQGIDPAKFIRKFPQRIFHVHMKDALVTLDGINGILASHLNFGDPRRGWDFRSLGRGGVNFEAIIRALNDIGYSGPLSVEWEDSGMERERGAREACEYVRRLDFEPSRVAFDAAFDKSAPAGA